MLVELAPHWTCDIAASLVQCITLPKTNSRSGEKYVGIVIFLHSRTNHSVVNQSRLWERTEKANFTPGREGRPAV